MPLLLLILPKSRHPRRKSACGRKRKLKQDGGKKGQTRPYGQLSAYALWFFVADTQLHLRGFARLSIHRSVGPSRWFVRGDRVEEAKTHIFVCVIVCGVGKGVDGSGLVVETHVMDGPTDE